MNTKTMRLPPRRVLTSEKRVIPGAVAGKSSGTTVTNPPVNSIVKQNQAVLPATSTFTAVAEPAGSNQLLAGYLAHEFLKKGTLFGEQWDPTRAQSGPLAVQYSKAAKSKSSHNIEPSEHKRRRYIEVANIIRVDGTHLPGIVNPTQLARSIQNPRGAI